MSIRKFKPLSDCIEKLLSFTTPVVSPVVLVSEIVAGGNWQVIVPFNVSVNFTGITPRLAANMLDPSPLIGGWMDAAYADSKIANGESELTVPHIALVVVSTDVVTSIHALFS